MGPSSVDAEIRSLGPSAGGDVKLLELFMSFVEHQLASRRDFELAEAYLGLFLKVNKDPFILNLFCETIFSATLLPPSVFIFGCFVSFL